MLVQAIDGCEERVVAYDSTQIPTGWGISLVVAGAQVSILNLTTWCLDVAKPKQGRMKDSQHLLC